MLKRISDILTQARERGWVLEPQAKELLGLAGIPVPPFGLARDETAACAFAQSTGYPLAAKVVSPRIIHKSDVGGVALGIENESTLKHTFQRFRQLDGFAGMLLEPMATGIELIIGAKMDYQFGPVILAGLGGTAVEIYGDTALRMAPLQEKDVLSMLQALKAKEVLYGFRGSHPIQVERLSELMLNFSQLVMEIEGCFDSIDLNPVMCGPESCTVADARIMLRPLETPSDANGCQVGA